MIIIPTVAWLSGLTAAMIFLIVGWPLANALSLLRILFDSFQMKLVLAAAIGVASAPLAESNAPQLQQVVEDLKPYAKTVQRHWDNLSDQLH